MLTPSNHSDSTKMDSLTLADHIHALAASDPSQVLMIDPQGNPLTAGALYERIETFYRHLVAQGVSSGEVVALKGPNGVDWVAALLACHRHGLHTLALSTRWTEAECTDVLMRADAHWQWTFPGDAHGLQRLGTQAKLPTVGAPEIWLATSGTTGQPKIARIPVATAVRAARAVNGQLALGAGDRWWLGIPLYHVGGLSIVFRCLLARAAFVMAERFDATEVLAGWHQQAVTVASIVPTMLQDLVDATGDRPWPPLLRVVLVGGAAVDPALLARCPFALPSYGLTEACAAVTIAKLSERGQALRHSGCALPSTAVRIVNEAGAVQQAETAGLIAIEGPGVFAGYLGEAPQSGWLITGDIGHLDQAGNLVVHARRDDLIVSGGENIYPAEVERVLRTFPGVREAAVVGIAHHRWGQRPVAWLGVTNVFAGEAALRAWLTQHLAAFKCPDRIHIVDDLPRLGNGKLDRVLIKKNSTVGEIN